MTLVTFIDKALTYDMVYMSLALSAMRRGSSWTKSIACGQDKAHYVNENLSSQMERERKVFICLTKSFGNHLPKSLSQFDI